MKERERSFLETKLNRFDKFNFAISSIGKMIKIRNKNFYNLFPYNLLYNVLSSEKYKHQNFKKLVAMRQYKRLNARS